MQATIKVLMGPNYSARMLASAILPFFAIDFSNESVSLVGNYRLSRFLNRLRGSLLDRAFYRALMDHIKIPMVDEAMVFPPQLDDWRRIIVLHNLAEMLSLPDWIPILNHLAAALIAQPRDMTAWSYADVSLLAHGSPNPEAILALFRAALVVHAPVPSATPASSWQSCASAHSLTRGLRVSAVSDTACALSLAEAEESLQLPPEFPLLGPAAKIRCLAESTADRAQIFRFLNTGAQVNVLRQVQDSLKWVASGIQ